MFERYTEKARRVIFFGRYEASQFGSPYIDTEHLLLGLLREDKALSHRLLPDKTQWIRGQIEARTTIRERVSTSVDLPLSNECKRALAYAAEEAEKLGHKHIYTAHLLLGLLREEKSFAAQLLQEAGVQIEAAREIVKKFDAAVSAEKIDSSLGSFTVSLTQRAQDGELRPFADREKEMESLILILGRSTKNSAVLVGEPGVGKRSIAEGLAQRMVEGNVPAFLFEKSVLEVDMARLASDRRVSNDVFLKQVGESLPHDKKSVLLMEDLARIMAAGQSAIAATVIEILKLLLLEGRVQCIATATPQQWEKALENYNWLDRCFRRIDVEPMSQAAAMEVLSSVKERYEKFHVVVYTADALQHAVLYSSIYVKDRHLPDKALDLLDEAAAYVNTHARLPEEVVEVRKRIRFIVQRMQNAIANHEFEKARFYSDEEHKERAQLQELLKKHNLTEGSPFEVTRSDIEEVLSRWTGIPVSKIRESGTSAANTAE